MIAAAVICLGQAVPFLTRTCLITGGAYFLFYLAFARIRVLDAVNILPDISYGVYLYGWPIQKLLHWYLPQWSAPALVLATLPICALSGWLSWQFVEKRFLSKKAKVPVIITPDFATGTTQTGLARST